MYYYYFQEFGDSARARKLYEQDSDDDDDDEVEPNPKLEPGKNTERSSSYFYKNKTWKWIIHAQGAECHLCFSVHSSLNKYDKVQYYIYIKSKSSK